MIPLTLSRLLDGSRAGDHPIAFRNDVPLTFARFGADVAGVATRTRALGCRRVALTCRDSYAFAVGLFALLHGGIDVVLLPNVLPGTIQAMRDRFDHRIDDAFVAGCEPATASFGPLDGERPALTFFTSGSTGTPKPIVKSLGMFEREAEALEAMWGASVGPGPVLAMVPHQHVYGLTFKLTWPLAAGRPFASETHELWESLLTALPAGGVVVSSPAHLGRLGGLAPVPGARRPSRVFSAGAPLSPAAAADAEAILGRRPTEIFGSTETGAVATRRQTDGDDPWRLLPGVAMRCADDGRLSLSSPFIGGGWFETADIVEPCADGFRFRGRADRIVKIEGKRVSLTDGEQAIAQLPWVSAAAAIVIPGDPARLAAAVTLNDGGGERLTALGAFRFGRLLRKALSDHHEPAATPRLWRFVDELPTAELGKRRDADIRTLFETIAR
jgi:acyl-coenzyme A synthetase/AMP-(fatty) acid ligase